MIRVTATLLVMGVMDLDTIQWRGLGLLDRGEEMGKSSCLSTFPYHSSARVSFIWGAGYTQVCELSSSLRNLQDRRQ